MKIIYRPSDGKISSIHADDAEMKHFARGQGEEIEELPESLDAFVKRVGEYGEAFFDGTSVVTKPPGSEPTLAGEIRKARQRANQRLDSPVTLGELETAEVTLRGRGVS